MTLEVFESVIVIAGNIAVIVGIAVAIIQLSKAQVANDKAQVSNELQRESVLADHERRKNNQRLSFLLRS